MKILDLLKAIYNDKYENGTIFITKPIDVILVLLNGELYLLNQREAKLENITSGYILGLMYGDIYFEVLGDKDV